MVFKLLGRKLPEDGDQPKHVAARYGEIYIYMYMGTAVAQWLRRCATSRKVAGSIPAGVIGIFHLHKIPPIALWPWGRLGF